MSAQVIGFPPSVRKCPLCACATPLTASAAVAATPIISLCMSFSPDVSSSLRTARLPHGHESNRLVPHPGRTNSRGVTPTPPSWFA
jgi:hypothetical protein